jgi:hypothetical protein
MEDDVKDRQLAIGGWRPGVEGEWPVANSRQLIAGNQYFFSAGYHFQAIFHLFLEKSLKS